MEDGEDEETSGASSEPDATVCDPSELASKAEDADFLQLLESGFALQLLVHVNHLPS